MTGALGHCDPLRFRRSVVAGDSIFKFSSTILCTCLVTGKYAFLVSATNGSPVSPGGNRSITSARSLEECQQREPAMVFIVDARTHACIPIRIPSRPISYQPSVCGGSPEASPRSRWLRSWHFRERPDKCHQEMGSQTGQPGAQMPGCYVTPLPPMYAFSHCAPFWMLRTYTLESEAAKKREKWHTKPRKKPSSSLGIEHPSDPF